jgi:hypothetical protein
MITGKNSSKARTLLNNATSINNGNVSNLRPILIGNNRCYG